MIHVLLFPALLASLPIWKEFKKPKLAFKVIELRKNHFYKIFFLHFNYFTKKI